MSRDLKRVAFALIGIVGVIGASSIVRADSRVGTAETTTVCVPQTTGPVRVPGPGKGCTPSEQQQTWVIGGDITEIRPGEGLVGGGTDGSVSIGVDPSLFAADELFAGYNDGPGDIEDDGIIGGALSLPGGRYAIFAKLWVSYSGTLSTNKARCQLRAGTDSDTTEVALYSSSIEQVTPSASMSLMAVHNFVEGGHVGVFCSDLNDFIGIGVRWHDLKIIAIEVSKLSNVFLSS